EAGGGDGRAADRAAAPLRLAGHPLHRAQGPARPGVPDLRPDRPGDPGVGDGQVPRLRALLRRVRALQTVASRRPRPVVSLAYVLSTLASPTGPRPPTCSVFAP